MKEKKFERGEDGFIKDCKFAEGYYETGCEVCGGTCPDKESIIKFEQGREKQRQLEEVIDAIHPRDGDSIGLEYD